MPAQQQTTTAQHPTTTTKAVSSGVVSPVRKFPSNTSTDNKSAGAKRITKLNNINHNNKEGKSPVDNFLTWLTSPLEIDMTGQREANANAPIRQRQQKTALPDPSKLQQQQQQQKQSTQSKPEPANKTLQRKQQQQQHQQPQRNHPPPKQFGEKIPIKKPDLSSIKSNSVHRISISETADDIEMNFNLRPELPSHVPTPETIDLHEDSNEPWTNRVEDAIDNALGGIHHRLQSIFTDINNNGNNSNKQPNNDHSNHRGAIAYAPSPITPPESPIASKKSKLLLTPTSTTKWGPDYWNSKKNSPNSSVLSISSSDSFDGTIIGDSLNGINLNDIATQENCLREAMIRKQKLQRVVTNKATSITSATTTAEDYDLSATKRPHSPSSTIGKTNMTKKRSTKEKIPVKDDKQQKQRTITKVSSKKINKAHGTPGSPTSTTTTPLQLKWMYENALNLQASCHRESIRICDGEDPTLLFPLTPRLIYLPNLDGYDNDNR